MDNILGCRGSQHSQRASGRTGPCQGRPEEFEDCLRVAAAANTFLECLEGAGIIFEPDISFYLSATGISFHLLEDSGR